MMDVIGDVVKAEEEGKVKELRKGMMRKATFQGVIIIIIISSGSGSRCRRRLRRRLRLRTSFRF